MKRLAQAMFLLALLAWSALAAALESVPLAALPPEARETLQRIRQGGPFPFPRDGIVFGNREKRLPIRPHGYYREYTVKTPGLHHRGARRIVCGAAPEAGAGKRGAECYYSDDHYRSFRRIEE